MGLEYILELSTHADLQVILKQLLDDMNLQADIKQSQYNPKVLYADVAEFRVFIGHLDEGESLYAAERFNLARMNVGITFRVIGDEEPAFKRVLQGIIAWLEKTNDDVYFALHSGDTLSLIRKSGEIIVYADPYYWDENNLRMLTLPYSIQERPRL